jgi:hypothetical protein
VALSAAQSKVDFTLLLPVGYGDPSQVFIDQSVPGGLITLTYGPGPGTYGLVITEMVGSVNSALLDKIIGPGTTIMSVDVGGEPGFWIEGQPHALFLLDEHGEIREDRTRLVGNTLLFTRDGITVRIESALDLPGALDIAESLEPRDP